MRNKDNTPMEKPIKITETITLSVRRIDEYVIIKLPMFPDMERIDRACSKGGFRHTTEKELVEFWKKHPTIFVHDEKIYALGEHESGEGAFQNWTYYPSIKSEKYYSGGLNHSTTDGLNNYFLAVGAT